MPKTKEQKKEILSGLKEKIQNSKSIVFVNFDKLTVSENENLRAKLRELQGEYLVAKKTLINLAFDNENIKGIDARAMEGKVAVIFSYQDEVAPIKAASDFKKDIKGDEDNKLNFLGGILEGKILSADDVKTLSDLPSRKELEAKLVGVLNNPISGFVGALSGNIRNLVYALKAIEEKKR